MRIGGKDGQAMAMPVHRAYRNRHPNRPALAAVCRDEKLPKSVFPPDYWPQDYVMPEMLP
jgi:hypothetical protein